MAIKFTTTQETINSVKLLVYGEAGAGKTKLCGTAESPVIISAESGLLSLADKNIPVIEVNNAADCFEALAFIQSSAEAKDFKTICLDSISDIAEVVLTDYKGQYTDARQAYGKLADDMNTLIRSFRDLSDRHVYMTAKMIPMADDFSGLVKYVPSMPGKQLLNGLPFFFDEVLALKIKKEEDGTSYRYLQTELSQNYLAKDRSGKLDEIEKPDLAYIFQKILGDKGLHDHMKEEMENA